MNQANEIQVRAEIIAQIAGLVYFNIPEEFWDGPENMIKHLEIYDNWRLQDILDWLTLASKTPNSIGWVRTCVRDEVHSLFQARMLITAQISMSRELVEKLLQKSRWWKA
jgi:hypothetical protein